WSRGGRRGSAAHRRESYKSKGRPASGLQPTRQKGSPPCTEPSREQPLGAIFLSFFFPSLLLIPRARESGHIHQSPNPRFRGDERELIHFTARDPMPRAHLSQLWARPAAARNRNRAAWMKHAA